MVTPVLAAVSLQHLDRGERLEEQLESVDYDIWICPTCDYALKVS